MFHVSAAGMLFRQPTFFLSRYLLKQTIHRQKQLQSEETSQVDLASAKSDNVARSAEIHNYIPDRSNRMSCIPNIASTNASSVREVSGDVRVYTSTTAHVSENATTEETDVTTSEIVDITVLEKPRSLLKTHNLNDFTFTADKVQTQKAYIQWKVVKNPLLYIYALTQPISDGSYVAYLMMILPHATDIGISKFKAVFLLSLMGICGGVSRLFTGWFADLNVVKKKHMYQTVTLASGILFCLFPLAKRYVGLAILSGLSGVCNGSIVVLAPVLLAEELGLVNMPVTSSVMYWLVVCNYLCSRCLSHIIWHHLQCRQATIVIATIRKYAWRKSNFKQICFEFVFIKMAIVSQGLT